MKHTWRIAAAALAVAGALPASLPASASNDSCVGQGRAETNNLVFYPALGPSATGSVRMTFEVGGCVIHSNVAIGAFTAGPVGNYCGHSTGVVSIDHHTGTWATAATVMVINGGINGVAQVTPSSGSCAGGTRSFRVVASVVLV
ncbi:MAG TPA: hypothetical protein VF230_16145 [Acidimicrobiales bacterium]